MITWSTLLKLRANHSRNLTYTFHGIQTSLPWRFCNNFRTTIYWCALWKGSWGTLGFSCKIWTEGVMESSSCLPKWWLWFTGAKQEGRDQQAPHAWVSGIEWGRIYFFILSTLNVNSRAEEIGRTKGVGRQASEEPMEVVCLKMMRVLATKIERWCLASIEKDDNPGQFNTSSQVHLLLTLLWSSPLREWTHFLWSGLLQQPPTWPFCLQSSHTFTCWYNP